MSALRTLAVCLLTVAAFLLVLQAGQSVMCNAHAQQLAYCEAT